MIQVFLLDIECLKDRYDYLFLKMPLQRQNKIKSYSFSDDKLRSLGAGILIDYGLNLNNLSRNQINITYNEFGKPYIEGKKLYFNISHSNQFVVCAFSNEDIGIDLQKICKVSASFVNKICTKKEINQILDDRDSQIIRLWTFKESYLKLTGKGITRDFNKIEIDLKNKHFYNHPEVFFHEYLLEGYFLTICSKVNDFNDKLIIVDKIWVDDFYK